MDVIIEYYSRIEDEKYICNVQYTLRKSYPNWSKIKYNHTASPSYIRRIQNDWNKYYENDKIVDIPIKDLTYLQLDQWAHDIIKKYEMNKKQYYNMSVIMRQCLEYATEEGLSIIERNPFNRVKVNSKLFSKKQKPSSQSQVFLEKEQAAICKLIIEKFRNNPKSITTLVILLNFQLGLRVGELVLIQWTDIENDYIYIKRMEIADYKIERDEEVVRNECKIVDFTKSSAGVRSIYLNKEARKIFCMRCMMSCIFKKRAVTKNVLNNMGDKILNFTRVI